MSKLFVIYYTPGASWQDGKPFSEQDLRSHGAYMKQLYDNNQLLHGGPFLDDSGGISIIKAESIEQAQAILDADPAIVNAVYKGRLHPWFSVDWDNYGS
jgi:uncharacterized protein YciI